MSIVRNPIVELNETYARLMACSHGSANADALAKMLASFCLGHGCMPARLGLSSERYERMMERTFPGITLVKLHDPVLEWDPTSLPESDDLRSLLTRYVAQNVEAARWIADIMVAGCAGQDHLWEDLGLWSRQDLSELFMRNFPTLAVKNNRNMKWKKFIYKQLCEEEGIYVCRAPSCEVCRDYTNCFGPED